MGYAVCPHCGSGENLATVGSVITYGTHVTNTEAVTIGMFGGEGMYRTWSQSVSQTPDASWLDYPDAPWNASWFGVTTLMGMAIGYVFLGFRELGDLMSTGFFGIMLACIIAMWGLGVGAFLGMAVYLVILPFSIPFRIAYRTKRERYLNSWYCMQHKIIVGDDGEAYSIADWQAHVFA